MKKFVLTSALLSVSLGLAACAEAGSEGDAADDSSAAMPAEGDTVIVDDGPEMVPEDDGSSLRIDNDGVSADINEPGVDASVDSDGGVAAEVEM